MRGVGGDDGEALDVEDENQLDQVDHWQARRHEHPHPDHALVVHWAQPQKGNYFFLHQSYVRSADFSEFDSWYR
jgi:hypothetical protein